MNQHTVVTIGILKSNAPWPTKVKYENKWQRILHHANWGEWDQAAHLLRGMKPDDHPIVAWLLAGL